MKRLHNLFMLAAGLSAVACAGPNPPDIEPVDIGSGGSVRAVFTSTSDFSGAARNAVIGQASGSAIESFKIAPAGIVLCQDVVLDIETNEPTNLQGCVSLLDGTPSGLTQEDQAEELAQARMSDEGFIDLASKASRDTLSAVRTLDQSYLGTYRYGAVVWRYPVKLKATFDVRIPSDAAPGYAAQTWRTRAGTTATAVCTADNCPPPQVQVSGSFADGEAAEEVVFGDSNGLSLFELVQPLVITADDVTNQTNFVVDLVYDLDSVIRARRAESCSAELPLVDAGPHDLVGGAALAGCNLIETPVLAFVPVVRREGEVVRIERYRATIAGTGYDPFGVLAEARCVADPMLPPACRQNFDVRLSLMTLDGDRSRVLGAQVRVLTNDGEVTPSVFSTPGLPLPDAPLISSVSAQSDGTLELQNYLRQNLISGFKRPAAASPGATVAATLSCGLERFSFAGCGALDVSQTPAVMYDDALFNPSSVSVEFTLQDF